MSRHSQRTIRRAGMAIDVMILLSLAVFVGYLFTRTPKSHCDVDRSVFPVKGIDISAHNGEIDFLKVVGDSVRFVLIKATEGTDFCDANFEHNYLCARDAGLYVGAYHFFRFETPGAEQARHFLNTLSCRQLDMPLVIDVEAWGNAENIRTDEVVANLQTMIDVIRAAGYPVMIYTNKHGYNDFIVENFEDLPLWICSLSKPPVLKQWVLWQHSHKSRVKGVRGFVDQNTFKGKISDFEEWASRPFTVKTETMLTDSVAPQ